MHPIRGRYRDGMVELQQPLDLEDGTEVEVVLRLVGPENAAEEEAWRELGMSRLEQEWNNPRDVVYDDWKKLYGV